MAAKAATLPSPSSPARPSLKVERNRFLAFAFAAADLLIEVTADLRITFAVGAAEGLAGRGSAALVGTDFLALFAASDRAVIRAVAKRMQAKSRMEPIALRMAKAAQQEVRVALSGCRMPFVDNTLHFAISALRPALADSGAQDEANLLTREAFEAATQALVAKRDTLDSAAALNLLQLDGVDKFRDRAGQGALDTLFDEIGAFLRAYAAGGLVGRIGPDRLAAISDSGTEIDFAAEITAILRLYDPDSRALEIKELAIALDLQGLTPADAAKALSYTFQEFANHDITKLSFHSLAGSFRELVAKTAQRVVAFKESMIATGMKIVFQPVVALATRRVHHYEVLTRFADNKSPFETIEFAERIGLIEEFDLTVCERALKFLDRTGAGCASSLAVNLSGRSIQTESFVEALEQMLNRYPAMRPRILFEITESSSIADLTRAGQVIQHFRRAGHKICLDDFGAGAASLPYLRAFNVDYIKIDGAYVRRMQDSERDQQILKAMIGMCDEVKTGTVAEMIETEQQAQSLLQLGVKFGQGYFFGKPADALLELATI